MFLFWAWPLAAVVILVYFFITIIPYFLMRVLFLKKAATCYLYYNTRLCSFILFKLAGVKLNVDMNPEAASLLKEKKAVCFISNHTSMFDIPAVFSATKTQMGFVAKKELSFAPIVNIIALAMHCIFIVRKSMKNSAKGIRHGVKNIRNGYSMLIFPEGTRSKTGEIAPFKHGSFRLAIEADAPIIPITIKGLRAALEDRNKCFGKYEAHIIIGKPVFIGSNESREVRFSKIENIEKNIKETYASMGE